MHALADAADHQGRRHQVRQDRGRRDLARPGADLARTRSTSSGSTPTTATWCKPAPGLHLPVPRGDRGLEEAIRRAARRAGRRSARSPRRSPTLVHGAEECEQVIAAARRPVRPAASLARTSPADAGGRPSAEVRRLPLTSCPRAACGGADLVDLLAEGGLVGPQVRWPSRDRGGRRLPEQPPGADRGRAARSPEDLLHGRYLVLAAGQARRRGRRASAILSINHSSNISPCGPGAHMAWAAPVRRPGGNKSCLPAVVTLTCPGGRQVAG